MSKGYRCRYQWTYPNQGPDKLEGSILKIKNQMRDLPNLSAISLELSIKEHDLRDDSNIDHSRKFPSLTSNLFNNFIDGDFHISENLNSMFGPLAFVNSDTFSGRMAPVRKTASRVETKDIVFYKKGRKAAEANNINKGFLINRQNHCFDRRDMIQIFEDDFSCSMEEEDEDSYMSKIRMSYENVTFLKEHNYDLIPLVDSDIVALLKVDDLLSERYANTKIYKCDKCDREFNSHTSLGGHIGKMHSKNPKPKVKKIEKVKEPTKRPRKKKTESEIEVKESDK